MARKSRLRGYEILEPVGAGAESIIYRARELSSGRIVAVKDVTINSRENRKYLRHVKNEYAVLKRIHARAQGGALNGVVKVCRLVREGLFRRMKRYALVMDYVEGRDLRRERRYPMGQMVDILTRVAETVAQLHAFGIVHGDLKPENVIVNDSGAPTLVDFGFSCRAGSSATSIRGTRDYMAPEQVNMGFITEKTDIYNFGATMYFLLTERRIPALLAAQGDSSVFIASRYASTPAPVSVKPQIPKALSDVILKCVNKESVRRPSTMKEVLGVLDGARQAYVN